MNAPIEPGPAVAPRRGRFLATALATGLQVGVDEFEVSPAPAGWIFWSRHTPFGGGTGAGAAAGFAAGHVARYELDAAWVPLRLEVESTQGASLVTEFGRKRTLLHVRHAAGRGATQKPAYEERMALPVGRHEALVLLSGGLSLPMLVVRRGLHLECGAAMQFTLLPDGLCELRREPDRPRSGESPGSDGPLRRFDLSLMIGGDRDRLRLAVDAQGGLVRFHARNRNLLVELDTAGAC